jgi:DNA-binding MarR family transcriptional regulator
MEITNEQVCQDVLALLSRFKLEIAQIADTYQLTPVQLGALFMLEQRGDLPMGKVAGALHCDPSNVTGVVDRLVAHELVRREESPHDRRAKTITLTAKGREMIAAINSKLPDRLGCLNLTADERVVLHSVTQKLVV